MSQRERGMVLVSVLWVLVAMTLAASVFSLWVDRSRKLAMDLVAIAEYEHASRSVEAVIIYSRATALGGPDGVPWPVGERALSEPVFDSIEDFMSGAAPQRSIEGGAGYLRLNGGVLEVGSARLMVRDRAGLIGLLDLSDRKIYERLAALGVGGDASGDRLHDALADYMDADQLHLLNGAEVSDYQRLGRSPPVDGVLRSPLQLRDVVGWDVALASKDDAWLLDVFRVDGGGFINANTASEEALELVLPSPEGVAAVIGRRNSAPFRSTVEVDALLGGNEELYAGIEPADGLRIWRWQQGGMTAIVDDIQFDALQPGRAAVIRNWSSRVALSEKMVELPVEQVDHPIFHAKNFSIR